MQHIKQEIPCFTTFPNIEKRVENSTRGRVFLMNFKVLVELFDIASQSKLRGNGGENEKQKQNRKNLS